MTTLEKMIIYLSREDVDFAKAHRQEFEDFVFDKGTTIEGLDVFVFVKLCNEFRASMSR